jgi:hypothetical protein
VLGSRFPVDLGMFFFFTNEGLIEWVLRKVGIRLVPDGLGATFVPAFVWVTGASILLAHWKDSTPAWLSSWLPPSAPWSVIAGLALGLAVCKAISTAFVRSVLPWVAISSRFPPARRPSAARRLSCSAMPKLLDIPTALGA